MKDTNSFPRTCKPELPKNALEFEHVGWGRFKGRAQGVVAVSGLVGVILAICSLIYIATT